MAIGIIVLFIGIGVYPAIAVKLNTSSTNTIDKVENKNKSINGISNFNLDRLNLLMFLILKPKLFTSMIKSYSKISDNLCKLSSKDCLEIVDNMVKEKLTMTLNALKIIESKGLIDSSKTKLYYEDLYLKISEISDEYNELSSTFETQERPICDLLWKMDDKLEKVFYYLEDILDDTTSWFVWFVVAFIQSGFMILWLIVGNLLYSYDCIYIPP